MLGRDPAMRRAAYEKMFDTEFDPEFVEALRAATRGGWAFGPADFKQLVAEVAGRRAAPLAPGRPAKLQRAS
jgi:hypothetical protein